MITSIYLWCVAIVFGLTAGESRCGREGGRCSFGVCLNEDDHGNCKSFDIEMNGGDCRTFNGSEEYADHYVRIKLMNGFVNGSALSVYSTIYFRERQNTRAHLYSVDGNDSREILNIPLSYKWLSMENNEFYERFPNDSNVMIPVGWAGTPVELSNDSTKESTHQYIKNIGKSIVRRIHYWPTLEIHPPNCEELKNPLVLHLTPQIFPEKICYRVPRTAASFVCPTEPIDDRTKVESKAENNATNCTIFDRNAAQQDTPPTLPLRQGFESGKMISVRASLKPQPKDFFLDILNANHSVAFQVKVEPTQYRISFTNKLGKIRLDQTIYVKALFYVKETFQLDLCHENDRMLIFVNNAKAARFPLDPNTNLSEAYLRIFGDDVIVDTVCYKDGKPPVPVKFSADTY